MRRRGLGQVIVGRDVRIAGRFGVARRAQRQRGLQRRLHDLLDRPAEVGQLVTGQGDLLDDRTDQGLGQPRRDVQQVADRRPLGRLGIERHRMREHAPSAGGRRSRRPERPQQGPDAERVGDHQRSRLDQVAHRQVDPDDEPVVAVAGQGFDHQHLAEIGFRRRQCGQVDRAVLELPEPPGRQPGRGDRRRHHGPGEHGAGLGGGRAQVDLAVDVELVPVEGVAVVAVRGQRRLVERVRAPPRRQGRRVLEPLRLPRVGRRVGVGEQRRDQAQPVGAGGPDLGGVAGRDVHAARHRTPGQLAAQPPAVQAASAVQPQVAGCLGVQAGQHVVGVVGDGERGGEPRPVVLRRLLLTEQPQEQPSGVHPQPDAVGAVRGRRQRPPGPLDQGLQRRGQGVEAGRLQRRVGRDRAGDEPGRRGGHPAPAGDHRRAAVLAGELADLPLPGQQPQRVVHRRGGAHGDVRLRRVGFEPEEGGDRGHLSLPGSGSSPAASACRGWWRRRRPRRCRRARRPAGTAGSPPARTAGRRAGAPARGSRSAPG